MAHQLMKTREKLTLLDGLVIDLFGKVEKPLDYGSLSTEQHLESIGAIHRFLHQIQKHEKGIVTKATAKLAPLATADERLAVLQLWLKENGVQMEGLELRSGLPEGCGVVASKEYKEGEMLATVPHHLIMSALTGIQSKTDIGPIFAVDKWFRAVPSLILAMHLLFEKHRTNPPSKWKGYIQSLPGQTNLGESNMDGPDALLLPLAFSMQAIQELRGTTALVEYHRMLRSVAKQYCHMRTVIKQLKSGSPVLAAASDWFSYAEFRWAVSMVMMRQNPIPALPIGEAAKDAALPEREEDMLTTLGLIPLLDMFNHEEGPITSHFDYAKKEVELTAKRDFHPGDQVFVSYGTRPNTMLLLYNGFMPGANALDRTRIPISLSESDPLYSKKAALLKWLELSPETQLDIFADGTLSPQSFEFLRVAAMSEEAQVTEEMRAVIAKKTQQTAQKLEQQKLAAGEASGAPNAHSSHGDGCGCGGEEGNAVKGTSTHGVGVKAGDLNGGSHSEENGGVDHGGVLSEGQVKLLAEACGRRQEAMKQPHAGGSSVEGGKGSAGAQEGPKGLGFGLKKGAAKADPSPQECLQKEIALTRRLWQDELSIIEGVLEKCKLAA